MFPWLMVGTWSEYKYILVWLLLSDMGWWLRFVNDILKTLSNIQRENGGKSLCFWSKILNSER